MSIDFSGTRSAKGNASPAPTGEPGATDDSRLFAIEQRLDRGAERMAAMQIELRDNTVVTSEVKDLLTSFRAGFRVLGWLGVGAKWLGAVAAAMSAVWVLIYQATHGGQLPK